MPYWTRFVLFFNSSASNIVPSASGRGCSASYNNWKTSLMFIHRIQPILSFKDLSCKITCADNIKLWLRKYFLNEGSFIKRQTSGTSSDNQEQRMTTSDNEWQQVTASDNEWQWVITSDNEWQGAATSDSSGRTNENDTVHFKEWMIVILSMTKRDIDG